MISQPLASQQCFAVPELVGEILRQFAPDTQGLEPLSENDSAALAILARTAKFFHEEALNLLWQSVYGMKPLLTCLPDEAWNPNGEVSIDFSRFSKYARRIKRLHVLCPNEYVSRDPRQKKIFNEKDAEAILMNLSRNQAFLLPEVMDLRLPISFFTNAANRARLLFGNKIRELEIFPELNFGLEDMELGVMDNMVELMRSVAKNLVKFELSLPTVYGPIEQLLSLYRQARDLQHLESVFVAIDKETFSTLSQFPHLRHVSFPFEDGRSEEALSSLTYIDEPIFPGLQVAHFKIDHLTPLLDNMKTWSTKSLEEIWIDRSQFNDTWDLDALFKTFHQTQNHNSLLCISIQERLHEMLDPRLESAKLSVSGIRSLFTFKNLRAFNITSHIPGIMNDQLLDAMSIAWPELWSFHFNDNTTRWVSDVSINAMTRFISQCKNLRSLSLSIDFSALSNPSFDIKRLPSFPRITSLGVRTSVPPSTAQPMISFLHHVFPKINAKRFQWDVKETVLFRDPALHNDVEYMRLGGIWAEIDMALREEYSLAMIERMDYDQMTQYQTLLESFASILREGEGRTDEGDDGENHDDHEELENDDDDEVDIEFSGEE